MYLTTKIHVTDKNRDGINLIALRGLCYHSARMYNVGLYSVRQHYFNTDKYLSYYENYHECKNNENYKILPSNTGQQILRLVDRDFKSFFNLIILKRNGKYSEKVNIPHYKKKDGLATCVIQGNSIRVQKNGTVRFGLTKKFRDLYGIEGKYVTITIPKHLRGIKHFKEIRIIPLHNGMEFDIELIYESQQVRQIPETADGYMSIDLGLDNLMACTVFSNGGSHQFIIDGRYIKSINHYYNKTKARLMSEYSRNKSIKGMDTKRFSRLSNGRNNKIGDYMSKAVQYIINLCFKYNVKHVVIGYNKGMDQGINIGRANNQNFTSIPVLKLRGKLKYKCELHGIEYIPQEESYTSKASCLDGDAIPVYKEGDKTEYKFSGKRVKRGLYRSSEGLCLNADINGSVNILRKYIVTSKRNYDTVVSYDRIRALVNTPCKRIGRQVLFSEAVSEAPHFREG